MTCDFLWKHCDLLPLLYFNPFPPPIVFPMSSYFPSKLIWKNAKNTKRNCILLSWMIRSILEYASAVWDLYLKQKSISMLRSDQVHTGAARYDKNNYRFYIKENQYNSVTKMINDLRWNDLADRSRDIKLIIQQDCESWIKWPFWLHNYTRKETVMMIYYMSTQGWEIWWDLYKKGKTRKSQAHIYSFNIYAYCSIQNLI